MILQELISQTTFLGIWSDDVNHDQPIINHLVLTFKPLLYNSREKQNLNIVNLINDIKEIEKIEYHLSCKSKKKETRKICEHKWRLNQIEKN